MRWFGVLAMVFCASAMGAFYLGLYEPERAERERLSGQVKRLQARLDALAPPSPETSAAEAQTQFEQRVYEHQLVSATQLNAELTAVRESQARHTQETVQDTVKAEMDRRLEKESKALREDLRAEMKAHVAMNAASAGAPVSRDELKALVQEVQDEQGGKDKGLFGEEKPKPHISELSRMLELDEFQQKETDRVLRTGQERMLEIFKQVRPNGRTVADSVAEVMAQTMRDGDTTRVMSLFIKLQEEKVPGSDQSFAAAIDDTKDGINQQLAAIWEPAQYQKYLDYGPDPTEIKIPNNPAEKYLIEQLAKYTTPLPGEEPR